MLISELRDKRILILGFGREGQDSFLFLRKKFPGKSLGAADAKEFENLPKETQGLLNRDSNVVVYFGQDYLRQLHAYDVLIKSPGIPAQLLKPLLKKNQVLTSQTNLFFANCPSTIIGVTGTKGKSTTASLIFTALQAAKKKAHLVGNIEEPVLHFLEKAGKDDIFVYELSSFQLEIAEQSPHIAVFLNLYPEHLDHHGSFKAYAQAKENIAKFQTENDYLIFNETDEEVKRIATKSKAKLIPFAPAREKGALYAAPLQPVFLVAKLLGISREKAQKAIQKFKPLPHRLQPVGTHRGIMFYNDSLATIPEATIAALDLLGNKVATLIVGGHDRGIKFPKLAERILQSSVRSLVLLPVTGDTVWQEIEAAHTNPHTNRAVLRDFGAEGASARYSVGAKAGSGKLPNCFRAQTMAEAVELCYKHTPKNHICLLSPAASSFNMFRDYKHRGEEFTSWVKRYGKKTYT